MEFYIYVLLCFVCTTLTTTNRVSCRPSLTRLGMQGDSPCVVGGEKPIQDFAFFDDGRLSDVEQARLVFVTQSVTGFQTCSLSGKARNLVHDRLGRSEERRGG